MWAEPIMASRLLSSTACWTVVIRDLPESVRQPAAVHAVQHIC